MGEVLDIFSKNSNECYRGVIEIDNREKNSLVPSELKGMGYKIRWNQLDVGDYIVNGVVIERKTIFDLASSIINKRIFSQMKDLIQYDQKFIMLEGIIEDDIYSGRLHGNAIRGFLMSAVLEFGIGIIYTYNAEDSAKYIDLLARKEEKVDIGIRASKIQRNREEQIQFVLEGFPNIGPSKAKELITKFGSLRGVFNASVEDLEEVLGKRAGAFRDLIEKKAG